MDPLQSMKNGLRIYQEEARKTAKIFNNKSEEISHAVFGLFAEVGEFSAILQKYIRDENYKLGDKIEEEKIEKMVKELGDILWYFSEVVSSLDMDLGYIAKKNIEKLRDRQKRNVISGSGDNR